MPGRPATLSMPQCCVCYEDFTRADVNDRLVGRQLSCGHEACTTCLEDVFDDGEICCPECFASTETASVEALPSVDADEAAVSEPAVADFAPSRRRFRCCFSGRRPPRKEESPIEPSARVRL